MTKIKELEFNFEDFGSSEADIIKNKKNGVLYVADFLNGEGKYISISEDSSDVDLDINLSAKINLRITYITSNNKISGVEIAKVKGSEIEKINFSTMDFERIIQLLSLFKDLDFDSIANRSIILNETIIEDPDQLKKFLNLVARDSMGKEKIKEITRNYNLFDLGEIDNTLQKKEAVKIFERLLNDQEFFIEHKRRQKIGKDEEVWQRFFSENSWILGSEFVEILDERQLDVNNITDYILKSYDGFVDIIELKLPKEKFWTSELVPRSELTAATMQCNRYILQTERKINDLEYNKRIKNIPIVKPRITLIYGRSNNWRAEASEAYRVLNSSYSNLNIISYDHLLERAKRLVGPTQNELKKQVE